MWILDDKYDRLVTYKQKFLRSKKKEKKMDEFKITKKQILEAAEMCPEAKEVLEVLCPAAFKTKDEDITSQVEWKPYMCIGIAGGCYLDGYYKKDVICWLDNKGVHIMDSEAKKFKTSYNDEVSYYPFKIIKIGD